MATTYTQNYGLGKQEDHSDKFDMSVITANADIIDRELKSQQNQLNTKPDAEDIAALQAQINQIEISASAEAIVAPEVAAARVGADGTSYQTLKERLDADVSTETQSLNQVRSDVGNAFYKNPLNLFDYYSNKYQIGKAVTDSGEIIDNSSSWITDYIPLPLDVSVYQYLASNKSIHKVCFYDTNKDFINKKTTMLSNIPDTAAYFIVMYQIANQRPTPDISFIQKKNNTYSFNDYTNSHVGNVADQSITGQSIDATFAESFFDLIKKSAIPAVWESGSISSDTGANSSTSASITVRTKSVGVYVKGTVFYVNDGYSAKFFKYSESSDFLSTSDWIGAGYSTDKYAISDTGYYRMIIRKITAESVPDGSELSIIGNEREKISNDRVFINRMKTNSIKLLQEFPFTSLECTAETIDSDGVITAQPKRMLTPMFTLPKGYLIYFAPYAHVAEYDNNGDFVRFVKNTRVYQAIYTDKIIRFAARNDDNSNMDDAGRAELLQSIDIVSTSNIESGYKYSGEKIDLSNYFNYLSAGFTGNGQDACIYESLMFAFSSTGGCKVVDIDSKQTVATFSLDQTETIQPHCNTAVFSNVKYDESDPFPLLYVNAYNTAGLPLGTVYVHIINVDAEGTPTGTTLLQRITVGFTDDPIWTDGNDVRPYGNFFIDTDNGYLYAYTLKDDIRKTRFFKFALPDITSPTVTLEKDDIIEYFDTDYLPYIQGNAYYAGKAYILNGFGTSAAHGCLIVVNLSSKKIVSRIDFNKALGVTWEPEFIDVSNNTLILGQGTAYIFNF